MTERIPPCHPPSSGGPALPPHDQDPKGRLNLDSLSDQIRWHVTNGFMPKEVPVEQVVDLSFLR